MKTFLLYVTLLAVVTSSLADRCRPGRNCKLPHCRCWMDRGIPGRLANKETPQIVLVTFGNSVNKATEQAAIEVMKNLKNPNNCTARATYFIEHVNSDPFEVKALFEKGFEIGLSTMNDTIPKDYHDWKRSIGTVRDALLDVGIPKESLLGFRAPQLYDGGDDMMEVLNNLTLLYDTTCVNRQYIDRNNLLWPYTYDYPGHAPVCSIGRTPKKQHKGRWQILMADLTWKKKNFLYNCPSPSACSPYLTTVEEVFQFLFGNFLKHYTGNRAPFNLYLDPLWLSNPVSNNGTMDFLDFVDALSDSWFLTFQQALDWVKYPVNKKVAIDYPPWGCSGQDKRRGHKRHLRRKRSVDSIKTRYAEEYKLLEKMMSEDSPYSK